MPRARLVRATCPLGTLGACGYLPSLVLSCECQLLGAWLGQALRAAVWVFWLLAAQSMAMELSSSSVPGLGRNAGVLSPGSALYFNKIWN